MEMAFCRQGLKRMRVYETGKGGGGGGGGVVGCFQLQFDFCCQPVGAENVLYPS